MNRTLAVILEELATAGVPYRVDRGKHYKVRFGKYTIVASKSPSDHRAALNSRSVVRKYLREMQTA